MSSILVIDVGTSGLRSAVVDERGAVAAMQYRAFPPSTPFPGLVEFDAAELARLVLDAVEATLVEVSTVDAIGVTNQRASTIVWDRATGEPVGPALGWQDLRTVGECIMARAEHGLALAPNQSATKVGWLLANVAGTRERAERGELCFGTVDTWVAWTLSGGALHVTDHSNAAVTGLYDAARQRWSTRALDALGIPAATLPELVDTIGVVGAATAVSGAPPIGALIGDQQGSLVGQGCVVPGRAKITFGTGGMLDLCTADGPPASGDRRANGTFPIVTWSSGGDVHYGVEGIMLSAGTNVEWLRDDLGLIATSTESHDVAQQCTTSDGVVYVPALLGIGTPAWDYGARGALFGITRGTTAAHVVRAVLEGVAHRGADLVEAAEADTGLTIPVLRIDGGMSANPTFVQALADASQRPVEVSPVVEATTLGAAFCAGVATGVWSSLDDAAGVWKPARVVEPQDTTDRRRWYDARARAAGWIPELSALDF
jgi:glycerol kinase